MRDGTSVNSNVTRHMYVMLHTRIRQLPSSGQVVTTGYPDPVPGEIPYPSHLYFYGFYDKHGRICNRLWDI